MKYETQVGDGVLVHFRVWGEHDYLTRYSHTWEYKDEETMMMYDALSDCEAEFSSRRVRR